MITRTRRKGRDMRRRGFALFFACLAAVALLAASAPASALSEPGNQHWRKALGFGNAQYLVKVYVPPTNPVMGAFYDNDSAANLALVDGMVAKWNAHSDVAVVRTTTACLNNAGNTNPNCYHFWQVSQAHLDSVYGVGTAGVAIAWADSTHLFNGAQTDPSRLELTNNWAGQPAGSEVNGICHEGGHMLDLDHWDTNDDGTPDGVGPCAGPSNPNPDATDNAAVDTTFDTCHADAAPAPGGFGVGGDGPCFGAAAPSRSSKFSRSGPIRKQVTVTTFGDLDG